jgi:outer membrane protein assembly factor BamA
MLPRRTVQFLQNRNEGFDFPLEIKGDTKMKAKYNRHSHRVFLVGVLLCFVIACSAQPNKTAPPYPKLLPYSFSNFVWWSDDELRGLLKSRIAGLGDEITPTSAFEGKMRDALKALLKEKGVLAEMQSIEPSSFSLSAERAPGAPAPSIVFTVLSPKVIVDKVVISQAPEDLAAALHERLRLKEGHEYSTGQDWLLRSNTNETLKTKGYLEAKIDISHDTPRREGDHFAVNLIVSIASGPQYRISSITADGGPLLKGRDLSSFFTEKPGDFPGDGPFGRLVGEIRSFYEHYGYAGVEIHGTPLLDRTNALVSYHLEVVPGPLYHMRSLTIHNLNPEQESKARELLGMKAGDLYDETTVNGLYHKLPADTSLAAYGFTFSPKKDKSSATVDLTLDFYKSSDKSSVTIN